MTHPIKSNDIEPVYQLLEGYSFDVEAYPLQAVIAGWLEEYGSVWVSHAITEALYQGRYKIVSVDHILQLWQRRGQPIRHFNREFESIILGQTLFCTPGYGDTVTPPSPTKASPAAQRVVDYPSSEADPAPSADSGPWPFQPATEPEEKAKTVLPGWSAPFDLTPSAPSPSSTNPDPTPPYPEISNSRPLASTPTPDWPQADEIQPFVPQQDSSDLHQRLQAVVKGGMRE
ncbi:hypothetical protein [Nodosilinea sp. E11]|uniref:hypothetical protein n=1 Tax=Nodosilinea sp. E11 TaxID=3037479 RepID=UPI0029351EAD|nr:hypothetical protein [Nodosilinea sp. E11]WOD41646.1 hypothetical protein RRF56_12665 [Nodosilinea sp. E11]